MAVDRLEVEGPADYVRSGSRLRSKTLELVGLLIYSIIYFYDLVAIGSRRHLWFDEVVTFFVAGQAGLAQIWTALLAGIDGQPPLFYIPVHYSYEWFGKSDLSIRLPSIIEFWLATLILYFAVSRRTSAVYGAIAALTPFATAAFIYSFEARPYALVLLLSALSFLLWQLVKENSFRAVTLPALTLTLAMAVCTHYYGFLIVIPLLAGEAVSAHTRGKPDFFAIGAMCSSVLPIILLLPHIRAIRSYSGSYWTHSDFNALAETYFSLFLKPFVFSVLCCAFAAVCIGLWIRQQAQITLSLKKVPGHELAASGMYLLLPIFCLVVSVFTKAFHYRYVIATIQGAALLLPLLLFAFRSVVGPFVSLVALFLALNFLYTATHRVRSPDENEWGTVAAYPELFTSPANQLSVSNDPLVMGTGPFLLSLRYRDPNRQQPIYLFTNAHTDQDNSRLILRGLQGIIKDPVSLADYASFTREHHRFLMYDPDAWLIQRLVSDGAEVKILKDSHSNFLYSAILK